ncbi:hypothetical protein CEXT_240161 [Caerostris extrusa]|uniref:Uncharacterized protein n=1 Tax=Caerostris extrusa TaxID=172846 RepID=A0AAV4PZR4_CAEEX|nr:hypothetical protein CEXT_240161 [Caerostris extrusa]
MDGLSDEWEMKMASGQALIAGAVIPLLSCGIASSPRGQQANSLLKAEQQNEQKPYHSVYSPYKPYHSKL